MSSSSNPSSKKRPLAFVSEGVTDLETQKAREQVEQAKFEAECKRRERKSLREQLRSNAINKQREFNGLVKERDDFNRLSTDELEYFKKLKEEEQRKENELKEYLEKESQEFALRQAQLKSRESRDNSKDTAQIERTTLHGVVKKKFEKGGKKKLRLKVPKGVEDKRPK